jgi:ATP-binding protein involved in chromosome partitioning
MPDMMTLIERVQQRLQTVLDPNTQQAFAIGKTIKQLQLSDGQLRFKVELPYPAQSQHASIGELLKQARLTLT